MKVKLCKTQKAKCGYYVGFACVSCRPVDQEDIFPLCSSQQVRGSSDWLPKEARKSVASGDAWLGEKRNQTPRGRGRFFLRFLLMVPVAKGEGRGNCAIEISRYRLEICRFHFFLLDSQIGEKLTYVEEKASHSFGKCQGNY